MDIQINEQAIVVTGGPGMGKTSLIEKLGQMGYAYMPESGRHIIQAELESGGDKLPWADRQGFAREMFNRAVIDYEQARNDHAITFFDRGLPDVIGYLTLCKLPVEDDLWSAARKLRYHPQVFITPPWEEIYVTDNERKQSFDEAKATYEAMANVYTLLGYSMIEIPKVPIGERAQFIIKKISSKS
jgi:Predicted ATPase